ncbi:MAG TPA: hypothetical protein PKE06_05260 [Flavilitoribacter sp.]|nr:hypothetical protein [Flavilitoribacter sp.]HMQ88804.1 hypothetical protein [Flavilitoribacter sp.]
MDNQNFDRRCREILEPYPSPLDTDALWKELEPDLARKKKKRPPLIWWWFGLGFLTAIVLTANGWFHSFRHQTAGLSAFAVAEIPVGNESSACEEVEMTPVPSQTAPTGGRPNGAFEAFVSSARNQGLARQPGLSPIAGNGEKDNKPVGRPLTGSPEQGDLPGLSDVENALSGLQGSSAFDPVDASGKLPERWGITDGIPPLFRLLSRKEILVPPRTTNPPQQEFRRVRRLRWFVRPEGGLSGAFKSLEQDTVSALLNERRQTEKPLEAVHAGLMVGAQHPSGWYLSAGLAYTRINERFDFQTSVTTVDTIPNGITDIIIGANGDTTFIYGPVAVSETVIYHKRTYNRYILADLPIAAGFEWEGNRWSLAAEAGIAVNLMLRTRGQILGPDGGFESLEGSGVLRPKTGLSYFGSLRLGYAVTPHLRLTFSPAIRAYPTHFLQDFPGGIRQSYTLIGVSAGVKWRF